MAQPLPPSPPPVSPAGVPLADPPPAVPPPRVPETRQLPPHQGKLARMGDHVAALSADLREWVDLRIELVKAEIRETIGDAKSKARRLAVTAALLVGALLLALYALGFLFGALAWALADWLGSAALGDLITALLLFLVAGVLAFVAKRRLDREQAIEARAHVQGVTESDVVHDGPLTRPDIQRVEAETAQRAAA